MKKIYHKLSFAVHPVLLSVYPVLFLYGHNIEQTACKEIILPITLSTGSTVILLGLLALVSRNRFKSSLFTSLFLFLFFSYGHVSEILHKGAVLKKPEYILPALYLFILIIFTVLTIKSKSKLHNITNILNIISLSLILISCFSIIKFSVETSGDVVPEDDLGKRITSRDLNTEDLPDIYYIILDGYAGEETLKNVYNFDNSEFLDFLRSKGFFVASKSYSNYPHTFLSFASTLNMEYLKNNNLNKKDIGQYFKMVKKNKVMPLLKSKGYTIINFISGSTVTNNINNVDLNIDCGLLNEFKIILANSTFLFLFLKETGFYSLTRKRILNTFREIPKPRKTKKPLFIFAHILSPHPPFLFNQDGSEVLKTDLKFTGNIWEAKPNYINQLIFINKKTKELIKNILIANSKAVIIIHADHGTSSINEDKKIKENLFLKEKFNILNALLLPGGKNVPPYHTISPVNIFRLLFTKYTDEKYNLLHDNCFFNYEKQSIIFTDVTEKVKK